MRGDHGPESAADSARLEVDHCRPKQRPEACLAGAGSPDVRIFDRRKGGGHARGLKCWPNSLRSTTEVHQGVCSGIADRRVLDVGLNPGYDPNPLSVAYIGHTGEWFCFNGSEQVPAFRVPAGRRRSFPILSRRPTGSR